MSRSRAAGRHTPVWRLAVGAVLVAIALGVRSGTPATASPTTPRSASSACPPIASVSAADADATERGWNRHIDDANAFSVDYPPDWTPLQPADPGIQFLASVNGCDSVEVRILPGTLTTTDMQALKAVGDSVLSREAVTVGSVRQVTVSGVQGWQYIYTFADPHGAGVGGHVHIFLFQANRVVTLVFQAIPADDLTKLASTFDVILSHVRIGVVPGTSPTASPRAGATGSPSRATPSPTAAAASPSP